jgi:tRNA nucleotidyltransferase (CCA-adding enzyme)
MKEFDFALAKEEMKGIDKEVGVFFELLKESVKKNKVDADVFVGGSYAKGTLAKSEEYDIDIFVRFNWRYENFTKYLEKILKSFVRKKKYKIERMHGSRDYFRIYKDRKLTFEVIPVLKIRKVSEARNVTDLSYFHVGYVKKKARSLANEIIMGKKFCKGIGVYGAESYIGGFSGYGVECLVINYGSFRKMLKELVKVKERIVLDPAKLYKKKSDILVELNESKLNSPIVLVDPTWKERNVLAALSDEVFRKFQKEAKNFLKKPSKNFFKNKKFDVSKFKKKKGELVKVILESDRQEGDIAGTKMKKFSKFLVKSLEKYFDVVDWEFDYSGEKKAELYLIGKAKKEVVRMGPPLKMEGEVKRFRKVNKNTFVKKGRLWSREKVNFSMKEFIGKFDKKVVKEMGISRVKCE